MIMTNKKFPKIALTKILNDYLEAKKILSIASDSSNPSSTFIRENVSIVEIETLTAFTKWAEDIGVHLINKNGN